VDETKDLLHRYLTSAREALLWKLDGLSDYDVRRPMTPTGTNLLGLVKHVASVGVEYFGVVFDRPFAQPMPWMDSEDGIDGDLYARADESREQIVELWQAAWKHADETIAALPLDAVGRVPWWPPERAEVTLVQALVHMGSEAARHAGHADIIRETIDGGIGFRAGNSNLPEDEFDWKAYVAVVQAAAEAHR
jgi:hypothetical protein